jgi:hypothetical protein
MDFVPKKAGKIAISTNAGEKSQKVFEIYNLRDDVEESFYVFKTPS